MEVGWLALLVSLSIPAHKNFRVTPSPTSAAVHKAHSLFSFKDIFGLVFCHSGITLPLGGSEWVSQLKPPPNNLAGLLLLAVAE